jgi:hypothetical protein
MATEQISLMTTSTTVEARANEIKIAKTDLFEKEKARALTCAMPKAMPKANHADDIQATNDSYISFPDFNQKEKAKAITVEASANEIMVSKDDIFQKEKARAKTSAMPLRGLMLSGMMLPSPECGRYSEFQ